MESRRECLEVPEVKTSYMFISEIALTEIETDNPNLEVVLSNNKERYMIGSIRVSENNLELLRRIYENNEEIECGVLEVGEYIILNALGMFISLVKIEDNIWYDLNIPVER